MGQDFVTPFFSFVDSLDRSTEYKTCLSQFFKVSMKCNLTVKKSRFDEIHASLKKNCVGWHLGDCSQNMIWIRFQIQISKDFFATFFHSNCWLLGALVFLNSD